MFYNFKQVQDDIIVQYSSTVLLHAKHMCLGTAYIITSRNETTIRFFRPTPTLPFLQPNLKPRSSYKHRVHNNNQSVNYLQLDE